ncbi:DUF2631 domain-containing protein [Nakamurella flavida]|uniref:DUF2631 domain-containing protein n=1 Tax=Nakamurella flavida TaxID=363630 RepID=A0A938YC98_9ACTN|nr:DUF2631 domain-containing protein [Nakamurella flavida]MBM9475011.1 DUF2631 domain-containing protein [Nakamurella flavida]MDP9776580.1 hypothetical protein [Nakamurella flavida]
MAGELERQQPTGGEEGAGTHASGSTMEVASGHNAVVSYNPDAPSEEWGWHGSWEKMAPRGSTLILLLGVVALLVMTFLGNHVSHTEDWWLIAIAIAMSVWIIRRARAAKQDRARRP